MMRKGDLAEYPVDWVLRQAARERLSGGIDFHTSTPACVHVAGGDVYLAVSATAPVDSTLADHLDDVAYAAEAAAEEARLRKASVDVLVALLAETEGWYFFHPLNHHPLRGSWGWDVEDVLAEATDRRDGVTAGRRAPASDAPLELSPAVPDGPLSPDAWAVLGALAAPSPPDVVAERLGWDRARLDRVLAGLRSDGVLRGEIARPRPRTAAVDLTDAVPSGAPVRAVDGTPPMVGAGPRPLAPPRPVEVVGPAPPPAVPSPGDAADDALADIVDAPAVDRIDARAVPAAEAEPRRAVALRRLIRSLRPAS